LVLNLLKLRIPGSRMTALLLVEWILLFWRTAFSLSS